MVLMLGFSSPVPTTMSPSPEIEEGEGLEGERDVAQRDDDPAHQHAAIGAEKAVGDQATQNRGAPDAARVGAVDGRGVGNREAPGLRQPPAPSCTG